MRGTSNGLFFLIGLFVGVGLFLIAIRGYSVSTTKIACTTTDAEETVVLNTENCPTWEWWEPEIYTHLISGEDSLLHRSSLVKQDLFFPRYIPSNTSYIFTIYNKCYGGAYHVRTIVAVNTKMYGCKEGEGDYLTYPSGANAVAYFSLTWSSLFWMMIIVRVCTPVGSSTKEVSEEDEYEETDTNFTELGNPHGIENYVPKEVDPKDYPRTGKEAGKWAPVMK